MAAPERQTTAARSEFVPQCAKRATLLAFVLLAACLNPMPEEFPSRDGSGTSNGPRPSGGGGGPVNTPLAPGEDDGSFGAEGPSPGDSVTGGSGGASPTTPPSPSAGGSAGEEGDAPDAGADAGSVSAEDTSPDGETAP